MLLDCVQRAAEALGNLEKYDLVRTTASGQRVLASRKKLLSKIERFAEEDLASLDRAVQTLSGREIPRSCHQDEEGGPEALREQPAGAEGLGGRRHRRIEVRRSGIRCRCKG